MRSREARPPPAQARDVEPRTHEQRAGERRHRSLPFQARTAVALFLYRAFIALTMRTAESPDEWWQSAEVAYHMVFGKGHLTWEWREGIRSATFPLLYAVPFWVLKMLGMDTAHTIYVSERLVQAVIATGIDLAMIALAARLDAAMARDESESAAAATASEVARRVSGHSASAHTGTHTETPVNVGGHDKELPGAVAKESSPTAADSRQRGSRMQHRIWDGPVSPSVVTTTTWLGVLHWYLAFDGARAYSGVAEGLLVMLALIEERYLLFLLLAGIACMVRATAAVALFPIFLFRLRGEVRRRGVWRGLAFCLVGLIVMVPVILCAIVGVDYLFYRRVLLTPWRFVEFNIVKNVSQYYGVYPFWWYFAVGLFVMTGPHLVFLVLLPVVMRRLHSPTGHEENGGDRRGVTRGSRVHEGSPYRHTRNVVHQYVFLLVWTVTVHSAVAHKEVRFMFPMLPILLILISFVLSAFVRLPQRMRFLPVQGRRGVWYIAESSRVRLLHGLFLALNIALFVFLGYVYRQGGVGVMAAIRNAPQTHFGQVDIVTHCYFTPGYSHVHGKVGKLRVIDCPMELEPGTNKRIVTEDALYRQYPIEFVWWMYQRRLPEVAEGQQHGLASAAVRSTEAFQAWFHRLQELMPASELKDIVLPDAIVVFGFVSDACRDSLFHPNGYVQQTHLFHAWRSMEDAEDSYVDLWVRVK